MYCKDKKGSLPDYNGALPQTPGFNALKAKACKKNRGSTITYHPHA